MIYLLSALAFVVGAITGGVTVYIVNIRRWHAEDMDEVLGQLELINSNSVKINSNVKRAVERFGTYAGVFEDQMRDTTAKLSKMDLTIDQNVKSIASVQQHMQKQLTELSEQQEHTAEDTVRILDRVKLLG